MHIGLPKERKQLEFRVGLIPDVVKQLIRDGHEVTVESGAGLGAGYGDEAYRGAGARVVDSPRAVFDVAELVVKVKEPQPEEMAMIRPGQALFTYLHLAADPELTRAEYAVRMVAGWRETHWRGISRSRSGLKISKKPRKPA